MRGPIRLRFEDREMAAMLAAEPSSSHPQCRSISSTLAPTTHQLKHAERGCEGVGRKCGAEVVDTQGRRMPYAST